MTPDRQMNVEPPVLKGKTSSSFEKNLVPNVLPSIPLALVRLLKPGGS